MSRPSTTLRFHPLIVSDFAGIGAESTISLQPHLQLLDLNYPVDELVLAVHQETGPSDIMSNAVSQRKHTKRTRLPKMRRSAVRLAVHRYENSVYYRRIDHEAFLLLSALQKGTPLGVALEAAFPRALFLRKIKPQRSRNTLRMRPS